MPPHFLLVTVIKPSSTGFENVPVLAVGSASIPAEKTTTVLGEAAFW
jgi:hypothetical protein